MKTCATCGRTSRRGIGTYWAGPGETVDRCENDAKCARRCARERSKP